MDAVTLALAKKSSQNKETASVDGFANEPGYNVEGIRYLVGANPTGVFTGHGYGEYAEYRGGQWIFTIPQQGDELIDRSSGMLLKWNRQEIPEGNAWQAKLGISVGTAADENEAITMSINYPGKLFVWVE